MLEGRGAPGTPSRLLTPGLATATVQVTEKVTTVTGKIKTVKKSTVQTTIVVNIT